MVVTRSQSKRDRRLETTNMSDNKSENSLPDLLSRDQIVECDNGDLLNQFTKLKEKPARRET